MIEAEIIAELELKLKQKDEEILQKDEEIRRLRQTILYSNRFIYGRRSEKRIPEVPVGQLFLALDGDEKIAEETDKVPSAAKEIEIEAHKRKLKQKKQAPSRQEIPADIERRTRIINPENIDLEKMEKIGEDVRSILHIIPAQLYVEEIIRPIYREKEQEKTATSTTIYQAPPAETFIPRSIAGNSVLTDIVIGKYIDHLPIYRQLEIYKRQGIKLSASTVNGWVHSVANHLLPLYKVLLEKILATDYIQVDESTIPVINNEKHRTVKSYFWIVRDVMNKQVLFHYDKGSRAQKVIISLLRNYQGAIQTDGYDAYSIYEQKSGVLLLGCWAHARRKFETALSEDEGLAGEALDYIALLYKLEANLREKNLDYQEIESERKRLAYPILVEFEKWMSQLYLKVLPKSLMGKAISYTYSLYPRLIRYVSDGRYNIDNNPVENSIRPMALGRKNYLFCGNHDAAFNTAIFYSLLGSCKLAEVNPAEWLHYVFENLNDYKANRIEELLPANWAKCKKK